LSHFDVVPLPEHEMDTRRVACIRYVEPFISAFTKSEVSQWSWWMLKFEGIVIHACVVSL
jgi:hypothetical protein